MKMKNLKYYFGLKYILQLILIHFMAGCNYNCNLERQKISGNPEPCFEQNYQRHSGVSCFNSLVFEAVYKALLYKLNTYGKCITMTSINKKHDIYL